ncbi:MAG: hypothetical protein K2Y56_22845 [Methylobacterium sp.]|uniref:hypothetical protein n=1 Tax=Methylobacterium sp. TaxID=409 RepID=UPI0025EBA062|nr:hypothetical protein [Methylobacterium sp.]MBX9934318.1 hypothetical protein [Methylobacterium sp.]
MITSIRPKALARLLLLICGASTAAAAADTRTLGNILSPAYLAMNFTVVCARQDPAFLSATGGPRGSALVYAQHIKDEVIATLDATEGEIVVREAANAARSVALGFLRSMAGGSEAIEAERVRNWCTSVANPFIRGVVVEHDTRHDLFEQVLEAAKRP